MRILVTGTEGYLGALLGPLLMRDGHDVLGVDTGFYKEGWLFNGATVTPRTLNKDIRELVLEDLRGCDAVVHMAELSNDPTGELAPNITYEINHKGSVRLAKLAKEAGVRRFIYMSSCSVYGVATADDVTEESPVNPQTAYAVCKTLCERDIKPLADGAFSPVFFRNATAFGASPRQRFDLVLNNLCGLAWTTQEIKMISDGTPWRPLVHGLDIARAIRCALNAPIEAIHGQVFNIGSNSQNYRVKEVAEIVARIFTGCRLTFGTQGADNRSYRVSFDKVARGLPGFQCEWDAERGARQLHALFKRIDLTKEVFEARPFTRLKMLQYLIRTQQIDPDFFWRKDISHACA
jgi:nucleoside-diphosphate-sugar epimerase